MNREDQISKILNYLRGEHLSVLTTVDSSGQPQAATMAFSETGNLELIFSTSNKTRKYKNLQNNKKVAVVVGMRFDPFITVQYEGAAHEATGEELDRVKKVHTTKNEESKKYADSPDNRFFVVSPKWIRYWDVRANEKFELNF